jgi:hypothetical protein
MMAGPSTKKAKTATGSSSSGGKQPDRDLEAEKEAKMRADAKREAHNLKTAMLRAKELKYILVGPPAYEAYQMMAPLYHDMFDLVEHIGSNPELDRDDVLRRFIPIVNNLGAVMQKTGPWLEHGLTAFMQTFIDHPYDLKAYEWLNTEEVMSAGAWLDRNPDHHPHLRNYDPEQAGGKQKKQRKNQ